MSDFERGFREELEKIAQEKMDPTWFEKHPVLTGLGPTGAGVVGEVPKALAQLGKMSPKAALPLAALGSAAAVAGQFVPSVIEAGRMEELSPEELEKAKPGWFARHPYWASLLVPGAPGFVASQTRQALERAGRLKE